MRCSNEAPQSAHGARIRKSPRESLAAYEGALATQPTKTDLGYRRTVAGTINAALVSYYQSSAFHSLAESTRQMRRAILERFRMEHGNRITAEMLREHLQVITNTKTPGSARNFKKALRGFVDHCISLNNMMAADPLVGLKLTKMTEELPFSRVIATKLAH